MALTPKANAICQLTTGLVLPLLFFSGCHPGLACPERAGKSLAGAYPRFTPASDSVKLGQPIRMDLITPYRLRRSGDPDVFDAAGLSPFIIPLHIQNQRSNYFSGYIKILKGTASSLIETVNTDALVYPVKADSSAVFSLLLIPADTGLYYIRFRNVISGGPCSPEITKVGLPDGNHQELVYRDRVNQADSEDYSHNYYFRVY